ncbi:VWA domain-containing protein [Nocardiopsis sp. NPDC058631]|uniref:VWA domain-containing protein n=1 Tax=Nocardiopsis sp. NPDC058631 TaxID=3346566 RepID=UPI00366195AB
MGFRYREYTGGPDPLDGSGASAGEAASDGVGAAPRGRPARDVSGAGPASGTQRPEAAAPEGVLLRYEEGRPTAPDGLDADAYDPPDGSRGEVRADAGGPDRAWGPRELRRLGELALRDIEAVRRGPGFAGAGLRGGSGPDGEPTGGHLPHAEGGDRALDAVATVREAALRRARPGERSVVLRPEDVRVAETEPAQASAVALLVDLSHSMTTRSLHEAATGTALALHTLVRVRHPQDRLGLIGFGDRARVMTPAELAAHDWSRVPGTNLHHALRLARGHLRRHRGLRPQVMVVTDGEPTAHLGEDGGARFSWPPDPRTEELTLAELDAALREGAEVAFFVLADDPRLRAFQERVERRRGVRVVRAGAGELGPLVVDRYLRRPV